MSGEFTWTTLDEEQHQFTVIPMNGPILPITWVDNCAFPSGNYRVVDGNLYRIVAGVNPEMENR